MLEFFWLAIRDVDNVSSVVESSPNKEVFLKNILDREPQIKIVEDHNAPK